MCIMFRDKSIIGFFKFLFCSGLRGGLRSRCDRRGPHSIVAGNVSSDSIPVVLGLYGSETYTTISHQVRIDKGYPKTFDIRICRIS